MEEEEEEKEEESRVNRKTDELNKTTKPTGESYFGKTIYILCRFIHY